MIVLSLYVVLLGLLLGSFIYTMALRLEKHESVWSRSHCDNCLKSLGILQLVPLFGYGFHQGKCPHCAGPVSLSYPVMEIVNTALVWMIFQKTGWSWEFIHSLLIFETLFLIAILDFRTYLIFPQPVLFGLLVQIIWLFLGKQTDVLPYWIGLCVGAGIFHWVSYLYQSLRKRVGLGAGDATLLGLIGFFFGWNFLLPTIFWSALLGIVGGTLLLLLGKKSFHQEIAFGPWIVLASFLIWYFPGIFYSLPTTSFF
ncbi:MAG: hypothetical protein COB67_13210 [SAR324 cluster bacterium]|uniref:Prepilin peptidase n=1 Tax=SAR324 cluster bacterium TaxID=2024889 RepID=A0A2A4SNP4_9DELT|nr:MAG: hypothetical protein COB67_13210 [SAR324 cluster bacterium]